MNLIEIMESLNLWKLLCRLGGHAVIVADAPILDKLSSSVDHGGATHISVEDVLNGGPVPTAEGPYFVVTSGDELVVKHRLRKRLQTQGVRPRIHGVLNDVAPAMIAEGPVSDRVGLEEKWESLVATKSLVITCTPRSGSQLLARELQQRGVGAPREHIRPPAISLFRNQGDHRIGCPRFEIFLAGLAHYSSNNDVFATKLISHFIFDLEHNLSVAEREFFAEHIKRSTILYLLRSNKLLQGLSRDRAKSTKHYHVFVEDRRAAYRDISQGWVYDFGRILREIRLINQEEIKLFKWLKHLVPPERRSPVVYETADIPALVEQSARAFDIPPNRTEVELSTYVLRDELTQSFSQRFKEDYRNSFRSEDPNTHIAHWFDYSGDTDALTTRTDPDSMITMA